MNNPTDATCPVCGQAITGVEHREDDVSERDLSWYPGKGKPRGKEPSWATTTYLPCGHWRGDPPIKEILVGAGFTRDELQALRSDMDFAITMAEAGQVGPLGEFGGGKIAWTIEKMAALQEAVRVLKQVEK